MVDQETAALRFKLFARLDQLFALPAEGAPLFFLLARHPNNGQGFFVPLVPFCFAQGRLRGPV
ncbi:MAG: hypothetical protein H0X34_05675 [Chthoniobacterales bacterium]|nr:hypothetical protein [Chthoniobacterales bacterium]